MNANVTNDLIISVPGPNGKAEVFEVSGTKGDIEYQVRFEDQTEAFKSMGEAYIVAGEKASVRT